MGQWWQWLLAIQNRMFSSVDGTLCSATQLISGNVIIYVHFGPLLEALIGPSWFALYVRVAEFN